jgi:hypothetical protein
MSFHEPVAIPQGVHLRKRTRRRQSVDFATAMRESLFCEAELRNHYTTKPTDFETIAGKRQKK